jgi:hypothetical protein
MLELPDSKCLELGERHKFASLQVRSSSRIRFAVVGSFSDGKMRRVLYSTDTEPLPSHWAASGYLWPINDRHLDGSWYTFPISLEKDFGRWSSSGETVPRLCRFLFWPPLDLAQVCVASSYEMVTDGLPNPVSWLWPYPPPHKASPIDRLREVLVNLSGGREEVSADAQELRRQLGKEAAGWDIHEMMIRLKEDGHFRENPYFESGDNPSFVVRLRQG